MPGDQIVTKGSELLNFGTDVIGEEGITDQPEKSQKQKSLVSTL